MRTIIMRRSTKTPRTGSGLSIESVGVDPKIESAGSGSSPSDLGFTLEIEDASMDEALKHPDTIAAGNPDMPMDLLEPFSSTGGNAARPASISWGVDAVGTAAPDLKETGKGVIVAVLDTGIKREHEAFNHFTIIKDDMRDFTGSSAASHEAIRDVQGHGTHCAGTIFGGSVDGVRIGVAPGVQRVIVGKIIGGKGGTAETIINAVSWAYGRGAQVISLSVGQNFNLYFDRLNISILCTGTFPAQISRAGNGVCLCPGFWPCGHGQIQVSPWFRRQQALCTRRSRPLLPCTCPQWC